ncbi:MAG: SAM-dependent methyltransferase, partial [Alphaproteobacteria bacterium]|nr:SAM-dependent methyltransferase [Alphaproteobacteria bacterium]
TAMLAAEDAWGLKRQETYASFARRVARVRGRVLALIDGLIAQGHTVGAFGAPAKGNTLLNTMGLGPDRIVAAAENNPLKIGKLTPGSHIPIVGDEAFLEMGFSHALLLSWNYADFLLANAEFIRRGGKFIIPLPSPTIRP